VIPNFRGLLASYSARQLFVRLAEEYLWWIIRSWPGFEGVALRYLFLRGTAKRVDGFCWISQGCTISNSYGLSIGKGFATARNVLIDAVGGIEIGDDTGIGPNTVILAQEHSMLTDEHYGKDRSYRKKPIRIGSGVWIGANCFIKAGVSIGDAAVVGACSNVIADVPSNGRVIGSPARPYTVVMREYLAAERNAARAAPEGPPPTPKP
jgi:acetyltransferase-like isoleucine patch superfamily enzyme